MKDPVPVGAGSFFLVIVAVEDEAVLNDGDTLSLVVTANENAWLLSEATSRVITITGSPSPTPSTVLAYALDKLDNEMTAAADAGKKLDFDRIMCPIEKFCELAKLPPATTASLSGRYVFTVTGQAVITHLMQMNAKLTLELLPTEVKSCWTIRCALRVFLLDAYSTVPMVP